MVLSYLITKTVLDRYRQVVFTNTNVYFYRYFFPLSLSTYSKLLKKIISLIIKVGSNAAHNITIIAQGCDVIHLLIHALSHAL
jgi:hypothetical protein